MEVQGRQVQLVEPGARDQLLQDLKAKHPNLVIVDYTLPHVIHDQVGTCSKSRDA